MSTKELTQEEFITGSLSCSGCGSTLAVRLAIKALGKRTVVVATAGCMSGVSCWLPQIPYRVPMLVAPFAATGSILQGICAGYRYRQIENINVLGIAGDGGTADIGMASFSQAIVSDYKFIYICVDNQAYMNTGVQQSGCTPFGATSTTTTVNEVSEEHQTRKDLFSIAVAHRIPYAATASTAYPLDYIEKVRKAATKQGPSFIQVLTPCPPGWGFPSGSTIEVGRLAVECGMWHLREYENGQVRFTHVPKRRVPVATYLETQSRFSRLKPEQVASLQRMVDQ